MTLRRCPHPLNLTCTGAFATWEGFTGHVWNVHTDPDLPDTERVAQADAFLKQPRPIAPSDQIVPKVTANPLTEALWRLSQDDRTAARRVLVPLGQTERRAYLARLTELINMLWEEL